VSANTYGRQVVVPLTNKSGGGVIAGDVVVVDTTNNAAFTTTTSAGSTLSLGVVQETIANNATGRVLISGYAALINVNASVTRGNYGKTYTVVKQATDAGASRASGTFCQFLTGGATPDAIVYPVDLAGVALTNPMTTKGDIILGDTSGVPSRLGAGTSTYVLTSNGAGAFPSWQVDPALAFHGCKAYSATTQSIGSATLTVVALPAEEYDTDTFHDPVTNNSRLTVGTTGYYRLTGYTNWATNPTVGIVQFYKNGTTALRSQSVASGANQGIINTTVVLLTAGDYVEMRAYHSSAGSANIGDATNVEQQTMFSIELLGI